MFVWAFRMWKIHPSQADCRRAHSSERPDSPSGFEISSAADEARRAYRFNTLVSSFKIFPLVPYLSAIENTLLAYRIHPKLQLTEVIQTKAKQLLGQLGLGDKLNRQPQALSQGERQRVAIARALMTDPPLILADEPTAGLDPERGARVVDLLKSLVEKEQRTLVFGDP